MRPTLISLCVLTLVSSACGGGSGDAAGVSPAPVAGCDPRGYPDQSMSPYVLPYEVGTAHQVSQGNCNPFSHGLGSLSEYSYDFAMPIGTIIVASRSGTVVEVVDRFIDGNGAPNQVNLVAIMHDDGSVATYLHLTENGAMVASTQTITVGEIIALSGNTGRSNGPHLHFEVRTGPTNFQSIPITFSNTDAHPSGLVEGRSYEAL